MTAAPPVPLSTFVGRRAELELGAELLEQSRLVTITGPGGAGKTRLCLELAGSSALAFADLSPALEAEAAQAAVAAALGLPQAPGGAGRELIVRHLRQQAGLLLVDNCEQVIDAAAELVESILVAAPAVNVLATSQEPLALPGERLLRLGALAEDDAERLFLERLREGDPRFDLDSEAARIIGEICRRLDSIPLALELAAARARTVPLPDLLAGLEDRFTLLVGASRRAPTRQQTLEAAVAWSYDLLQPEERTVFDRVAVLPGMFTPAAALAVAGETVGGRRLPLVLSRLGERSLLELAGDRYRMVETLRAFGQARLHESGQLGDTLLAAARHYDSAGAFRTGLGLSMAALGALDRGDPRREDLLDLAASQSERVARYDLGAKVLEELRASPVVLARPDRLANVEMRLASALSMATGEIAQAQPPAEHALALYRELGDVPMMLQAEVEVCWLDGMSGAIVSQGRRAQEVLARAAVQAPRSDAHLHALGCAAVPLIFTGRFREGREMLELGVDIAESNGDTYQVGWFTGFLAHAVAWMEGPLAALRLLERVRPRVEEHLDPVFVEGETHSMLLAGRPGPLLAAARVADDPVIGFGLRGGFVMSARAAAAAETGQAALAEELLASAVRLFGGTDIYYQLRAHAWLRSVVAWCGGRDDPARRIMRAADGLLERGVVTVAALALRDAADAAWDSGDSELEAQALERLHEVASPLEGELFPALLHVGDPGAAQELGRLGCLGMRARSLEREGKLEEAAAAYEDLDLRYRADRALARLARRGAEPSPLARRLARLVPFEGISAGSLDDLAAATVRQSFGAGDRLLVQDTPADAVFAIEAGRVRSGGATSEAGDVVGERSLLPGEHNVLDATAEAAVEALRIPPQALLDLVRSEPRLAERLVTLVRQRVRAEARATGRPEPPDIAARFLGGIQQAAAAAGESLPAYEILPVYLSGDEGPWLLTPAGGGSWLVDAPPARLPADIVAGALDVAGMSAEIVHSTSWRFQDGRLVLTYLAIMPGSPEIAAFSAAPVRRADLARGSAKGAPKSINLDQVVEHGLRHLSWLSRDDPVIKAELSPAWLEVVAGYQPEPFRAL